MMGRVMAESKGSQDAKGQDKPTVSGTAASRRTGWSRWRPYSTAIVGVAAVFAVSAVIGAHVRSGEANVVKVPTGVPSAAPGNLAVPIKPAIPVTVTIYEDLRSPASRAFDAQWNSTFDNLLNSGKAEIAYRLVTPTDAQQGGTGSKQAANAAACAQDQGKDQFEKYVALLWKKQPPVSQDKFSNAGYLERLGRDVRGLQANMFVPCVQSGDHDGWVDASQKDYVKAGLGDVPVIQVNDVTIDPAQDALTPAKLRKVIDQQVAVAVAHPSPSPSSS
jgi:protein-disulfide isomerase